ncbi:MAG: UTP--glucose-1-phosphate uridylyltransferase [Pirellulales bacterium]
MNRAINDDELVRHLAAFSQEHVLAFWHELDPQKRDRLAAQVEQLDLRLLDELFRNQVAGEDWARVARRAAAPPAFRLNERRPSVSPEQAHQRGRQALEAGHVGVILVAGGQGTRLGFQRPKGMFSIGPVSGASLFQILFEKIAARSRAAQMRIPLYLMTSPATHEDTVKYLAANEYFGLASEDVRIFCQAAMPAVDAVTGRLLLAAKGELALSPDGHGGTLPALAAGGCLADIRARGLRQLFYCQVDNPLVEMCDPLFLGYHLLSDSDLSTLVVAKRHSRERVGNVVSIDGQMRMIEYSDLNPLEDEIVERRGPEGGPVFWAGNTAIHVFDAAFLESMAATTAALPFHAAKKAVGYVDAAGRTIAPRQPNAIKFERFIFDLLPAARRAIVVEVDPARAFAPVKNAPGADADTPESAQAQMIALHAGWLRAAGCEVADGVAVEVSPMFAQNAQELAAQIRPGMAVTGPRYFC